MTRTRILLTRIEDWERVATVHGEFFASIRPANTIMQVVRFIDPDWLVEIEADAVLESLEAVNMKIDDERPFTEDMKRIVAEQRLAFVATVCSDGTPNLSPKGTIAVWDATHLVFADIRSPGTVANLKVNPTIEINVVDPFVRKGYRFMYRPVNSLRESMLRLRSASSPRSLCQSCDKPQ